MSLLQLPLGVSEAAPSAWELLHVAKWRHLRASLLNLARANASGELVPHTRSPSERRTGTASLTGSRGASPPSPWWNPFPSNPLQGRRMEMQSSKQP